MSKQTKVTDKEEKEIMAYYIECQSYNETAKHFNRSDQTIINIVKRNKDKDVWQMLEQKKLEHTLSTLEYMDRQHETKKRVLDKLLKGIELKADDIENIDKMNIKDLATAYGIILDKELKVLELKQKREDDEEDLQKVKDILVTIKEVADNDK